MTLYRLSTAFLTSLLALGLQLPVPSKAAITQRKGSQESRTQRVRANNEKSVQFDCLPDGFELNDIVSYKQDRKGIEGHITIRDKLTELKAHCKDGRLIDSKGRETRFFRLACYGNPPSDYDEIEQKKREELDKLQKDYTVVIMECDPRIQ